MSKPTSRKKSAQVWSIPHRSDRTLRPRSNTSTSHTSHLEQAMGELKVGDHINGRFKILERIGKGGMSMVYRAMDQHRNQEVALKCISPSLLQEPDAVRNFIQEVKIASHLTHPGIVKVFDAHSHQGIYFLEMELLEGTNLREWMKQTKNENKSLSLETVHSLIQSICSPLLYAHTTTVHRDLKPENIAMLPSGDIKIMDFGLAQVIRAPHSSLFRQSVHQLSAGTPYYMAPEILASDGKVDSRADQYSLAVIAFELLTERLPLGISSSLYDKRPDLPLPFTEVIDRALNHQPEKRFDTIEDFSRALAQGVRPEGWITKTRRRWKSAGNAAKAGVITLICSAITFLASSSVRQDLLHRTEQIQQWNAKVNAAQITLNQLREAIQALDMEREILHRKMEVEGAIRLLPESFSTDWTQASNQWHAVDAAYQWFQPRLNAAGHWDAMSDLMQMARRAIEKEDFKQAGSLFERLDQESSWSTNMVSIVKEAHQLRDAIVRLTFTSASQENQDPVADVSDGPSLDFLSSAQQRAKGVNALKEMESGLRANRERLFQDALERFDSIEQQWIHTFPDSLGPPDLRFLVNIPKMKAQALDMFQAEQFDAAMIPLNEATETYQRWTQEVTKQRMKAQAAWTSSKDRVEALDMRFVKVGKFFWSIWETRIMDFARWLSDNPEIAQMTLNQLELPDAYIGPTYPITGLDRRRASGIAIWFGYQMSELGRPAGMLPSDEDWFELWQTEDLDGDYQFGITPVEDPARLLVYRDYYLDQKLDPNNFLKPTGTGTASPSGLFDLQGNAWEWSSSDLVLDRRESNNQEPLKWKLHGGGYFGQHRFNEFEPPRENAVFITRPQAIGFRILLRPTPFLNKR